MADVFGYEGFQYEYVPGWPTLPEGYTLLECPGVAVDSHDNVFLLTRGEHPLMQFDKDGNFIKSFGEGYFSSRTQWAVRRPRRHAARGGRRHPHDPAVQQRR